MRAFSSGAVALSGVEAVSNGVPAFRRPEPRNASMTLIAMGTILGGCFFGLSVLAHHLQPIPQANGETVLSIMGTAVFGDGTFMYYLLQFSTFAILILAANTAYADFPRLSSIISRDGYLPRQLSNRGDRLVFSNGVLVLAGLATVLIVIFKGDVSALIPLYAVGVFTGFTLSQAGMVVHHWRLRERHWLPGAIINAIGAVATGIVLTVVVVSKFAIGAWIPAALIPVIVVGLKSIGRHYDRVRDVGEGRAGLPRRRATPTSPSCSSAASTRAPSTRCQLRPVAGARPAAGRVGGGRPGRAGGADQAAGTTTTSRSSCTPSTRPTGSSPGPSSSTSTSSTRSRPTR